MDAQRKLKIEQAAQAIGEMSLTDEELANAIAVGEEVLTYLRARGVSWALASNQLVREIDTLYGFRWARDRRGQLP